MGVQVAVRRMRQPSNSHLEEEEGSANPIPRKYLFLFFYSLAVSWRLRGRIDPERSSQAFEICRTAKACLFGYYHHARQISSNRSGGRGVEPRRKDTETPRGRRSSTKAASGRRAALSCLRSHVRAPGGKRRRSDRAEVAEHSQRKDESRLLHIRRLTRLGRLLSRGCLPKVPAADRADIFRLIQN